jgi:sterol desaturase/sphingolipid hydroxylase (fatty acid hydroxylase superfamily)
MTGGSPSTSQKGQPNPILKSLYIVFNLIILLNTHSCIPHADASTADPGPISNETISYDDGDGNGDDMRSDFLPSIVVEFLNRMKKNGVDGIELMDLLFCSCVVLLGMDFLGTIILKITSYFRKDNTIPVRGKHLDDLSHTDNLYIALNKIATVPFIYTFAKFMFHEPNAPWSISAISIKNTILPLPAIFIIYDFFYTILHWALHIQTFYAYIHKHHHRQKAPSRGNTDAVNVHPIEFFLGEYNHLFAVYIYTHLLGKSFHIVGLLLFLVISATLTTLNHSRYDNSVSIFGKVIIYDSKWHDVHHRIPQSNYGQYINFWDLVFGSFRAYNEKDRVNPKAQLDPKTGKSLEYGTCTMKQD